MNKYSQTHKSYIAFIDILGFKEIIRNNRHSEVSKTFDTVIGSIISEDLNRFNLPKEGPLGGQGPQFKIESLFISDSIILWSKEESPRAFIKLILIANRIIGTGLSTGLPMRGCISCGDISVYEKDGNRSVFGLPFNEAYLTEINQQWSGCIVLDKCIDLFEKQNNKFKMIDGITTNDLPDLGLAIKYRVPMKDGKLKEYWVLNWPKFLLFPEMSEDNIRKSFGLHNKIVDNWKVENIIKNTIDFYNYNKKAP